MPTKFCEVNAEIIVNDLQGLTVSRWYEDDDYNQAATYLYTTDPGSTPDFDLFAFDVRHLPCPEGYDAHNEHHHSRIIIDAIEAGLLAGPGQPAGDGTESNARWDQADSTYSEGETEDIAF